MISVLKRTVDPKTTLTEVKQINTYSYNDILANQMPIEIYQQLVDAGITPESINSNLDKINDLFENQFFLCDRTYLAHYTLAKLEDVKICDLLTTLKENIPDLDKYYFDTSWEATNSETLLRTLGPAKNIPVYHTAQFIKHWPTPTMTDADFKSIHNLINSFDAESIKLGEILMDRFNPATSFHYLLLLHANRLSKPSKKKVSKNQKIERSSFDLYMKKLFDIPYESNEISLDKIDESIALNEIVLYGSDADYRNQTNGKLDFLLNNYVVLTNPNEKFNFKPVLR